VSSSSHSGRGKIVPAISHDAEKRVIGLENPTLEIPDKDPDNIGIHQAPDLRFAFCEIAIGDLQVVGQRIKGSDHPLQLVLVPAGRTPQMQRRRRVVDLIAVNKTRN
jgi:hypothetical protein